MYMWAECHLTFHPRLRWMFLICSLLRCFSATCFLFCSFAIVPSFLHSRLALHLPWLLLTLYGSSASTLVFYLDLMSLSGPISLLLLCLALACSPPCSTLPRPFSSRAHRCLSPSSSPCLAPSPFSISPRAYLAKPAEEVQSLMCRGTSNSHVNLLLLSASAMNTSGSSAVSLPVLMITRGI